MLQASNLDEAALRVLSHPAVADKTFLITIGDRTVGGQISRDQMVGPWQVPVADVAVTLSDYFRHAGEAMAMGERTPLALLDPAAAARMAVTEAVTNILAADIASLSRHPSVRQLDGRLRRARRRRGAVRRRARRGHGAVSCAGHRHSRGQGFAVDENRLARRRRRQVRGRAGVADRLGVCAGGRCAPHADAAAALWMRATRVCCWIDLGGGRSRLGASILAQVYGELGDRGAGPGLARAAAATSPPACARCAHAGQVLAYHDISDGGLFVTLAEMAFASRCGLSDVTLPAGSGGLRARLFAEEPGAVIQVRAADRALPCRSLFAAHGLGHCTCMTSVRRSTALQLLFRGGSERAGARLGAGCVAPGARLRIACACCAMIRTARARNSPRSWMSPIPACTCSSPSIRSRMSPRRTSRGGARPRVAVLREQGVNSQVEMAAVLDLAGFEAHDMHMS